MDVVQRFAVVVVAVLALGAAGCSGSDDPGTVAAPVVAVDTTRIVSEVAEATTGWLERSGAPGVAVTVVGPDGLEVTEVAGLANLAGDEAVTAVDHWRFGSITKPMTSAVILDLAEDGLVDLDAPVATYLGEGWAEGFEYEGVDYGDTLTVSQMLNHTAGFAEFAFDPGFYLLMSDRLDQPLDPQEIVDWAVERGPQYEPGTDYLYNTVGHVVAGLIIEEVTGRPAGEVLAEVVFAPAGANDAYLPPTSSPADGVVRGYAAGPLADAIASLPALAALESEARVGDLIDISVAPQEVLTTAGWTGGGIEAQSDDIARIMRAMFDGTILGEEAIAAFGTTVPGENYGLGITVGEIDGYTVYSHGGGVPGFRSDALYIPELDIAVAASTNVVPLEPDVDIAGLTSTLASQLIAAFNGAGATSGG